MLLTGAEATLRLFICRDLALNLNLKGRLRLHALFTLRCGGSGCCGETRLFGELGVKIRDARLKCAALLCGSSDPSGCTGNGGIATCARQLPGAQGGSICLNGGGEIGTAGGQLSHAGSPLRRGISGNRLFRGEGDLIQSRLGRGDGGVEPTDAFRAL